MKNITKTMGTILVYGALSMSTYSASVDYLMNQAPAYLGNMAQNATISVEGANFNPAGLSRLEDGRYLQLGNQFGFIHEGMSTLGSDYDSDTFEAAIPNIILVDKKGDIANYISFGVIGGGATLEYEDGVPGSGKIPDLLKKLPPFLGDFSGAHMTDSAFEGSNRYLALTAGRAYNVNDKLSLSLAGRFIYATRSIKGYAKYAGVDQNLAPTPEFSVDAERTAFGFGGILGLNYALSEKTNIGARYETKVKLEFEADTTSSNAKLDLNYVGEKEIGFLDFYPVYTDGDKRWRDLPAVATLGASHKLSDKWTVMAGGNYYFIKDADLDGASGYDNGYELNIGLEYEINSKWSWTLGYNYADTGASEETYSDVEYALNSDILGTGFKYRPNTDTEWVFSVANIAYDSATAPAHTDELAGVPMEFPAIKYEKSFLAFGVSYTRRF